MVADRFVMIRTETFTTSRATPEHVWDVVTDLPSHVVWSGERARDDTFQLLELESDGRTAEVGVEFTSIGAELERHVPRSIGGHPGGPAGQSRDRDRCDPRSEARTNVGSSLRAPLASDRRLERDLHRRIL
jgi:hypothetical protein